MYSYRLPPPPPSGLNDRARDIMSFCSLKTMYLSSRRSKLLPKGHQCDYDY